jgi:hypothetical protein
MNEERSGALRKSANIKRKRRIRFHFGKKKMTQNGELFSDNRMYYENLADKYHTVRSLTALLLVLVIFAFCSLTYSFLTDNQFRYLYKIWKINPVSIGNQYQDISYAAGNGAKFIFYKNDLAVIESGKIAVYDLTGDRQFREEAPNSAQASAVSDKYIALYTPGDKRFAIYDSFSAVYDHVFAYPIRLAAISDSGKFALCLREEERIVIEVYNQSSVKEFSVSLKENTVVYDLDLSPNGDKLAITTIEGGDLMGAGNYYTEFSIWDISSQKKVFSEKFDGKKPVDASFFDNSRLFFAMQGSVIFCQSNGKKTETVTAPSSCKVTTDGNTVAVTDGTSLVSIYNARGEKKSEFSISEKIVDLKVKNDCCYVFSTRSISAYDSEGQLIETYPIKSGAIDFFPLDDGSLLVCYVSETNRIAP